MAYTTRNFKTKKKLKEVVKEWSYYAGDDNARRVALGNGLEPVRCYQPGLGPDLSRYTGTVCLEGPHYPAAHTWYAVAQLVDGVVVKIS